jgi:putative flippase GtrA
MKAGLNAKAAGARLVGRTPVRYVLAGAVNTAVGLSVSLSAMRVFACSWAAATAFGFAAGWISGFFLSRRFIFASRLPRRVLVPRYAAVVLAACGLAGLAGSAAAEPAGRLIACLAPMPVADRDTMAVWLFNGFYAVFNYAGQRWLVFRR